MPSGESDWIRCYFCLAKCVQVENKKKTQKKGVELDPHLVGNGLSLLRSFAVRIAVMISMRQKIGLQV